MYVAIYICLEIYRVHRFDSWFSSGPLGVDIATKVCMHNKHKQAYSSTRSSPDITVKARDQLSNAIEFL